MPTLFSDIETQVRLQLDEATARHWTSAELIAHAIRGARDLWRDFVDLKAEHYLEENTTDVFLDADATQLTGVPDDVHKVYLIEPLDTTTASSTPNLFFEPMNYNAEEFRAARAQSSITPSNAIIYYAITGVGAPVSAPVIRVAPKVNSQVALRFSYIPTLGNLTSNSIVPIPAEAENALINWTLAYARAREREDRAPDANWISFYKTDKDHLLNSSGQRQLQEPEFVKSAFEEFW